MSSANLFGTFLDAFATSSAARKADLTSTGSTAPSPPVAPVAPPPAAPAQADPILAPVAAFGELAAAVGRLAQPLTAEVVDAVLKELLSGPHDLKDLMPIAGNSVGLLLQVLDKIVAAGWVAYNVDKRVALTDQGEQIARLIA